MYDGIIFDIDGTLWDSRRQVAEAWNLAVKEKTNYDIYFDYEEIGKLFGKPMDEIFQSLLPDMPSDERRSFIRLLYSYEHSYLRENPPVLYDGAGEVLKNLSAEYPLFIVTNAQKGYIELLFEATGTRKYFKDTLCYGDTNSPKDVTIGLLVKKNNLKAPVYIGDTQGDSDSCKKAGVPMIWASYGLGTVKNPQTVIDDIRGLPKVLKADID